MRFVLLFLMVATAVVLVAGLYVTYKGGATAEKYSNALMRWRVVLQTLAIVVLGFMMYTLR